MQLQIKTKRILQRSGSFASMAAFHDMQTGEKQKAMEVVIEQQAEKKWEEEESGEGDKINCHARMVLAGIQINGILDSGFPTETFGNDRDVLR